MILCIYNALNLYRIRLMQWGYLPGRRRFSNLLKQMPKRPTSSRAVPAGLPTIVDRPVTEQPHPLLDVVPFTEEGNSTPPLVPTLDRIASLVGTDLRLPRCRDRSSGHPCRRHSTRDEPESPRGRRSSAGSTCSPCRSAWRPLPGRIL